MEMFMDKTAVLLPSEITLLSNKSQQVQRERRVLLPSEITLRSNRTLYRYECATVLLPSEITLLSNLKLRYGRSSRPYKAVVIPNGTAV